MSTAATAHPTNTNTNMVNMVKLAIKLQSALGHSAGGIALEQVEALCARAPLGQIKNLDDAIQVQGDLPEYHPLKEERSHLLGIWLEASGCNPDWPGQFMPLLAHSTPRGAMNWDLTGGNPRVWIERSKPGQSGHGMPGEEVVSWYPTGQGHLNIGCAAESRHLHSMSSLIAGVDEPTSADCWRLANNMQADEVRLQVDEVKAEVRRIALDHPVVFKEGMTIIEEFYLLKGELSGWQSVASHWLRKAALIESEPLVFKYERCPIGFSLAAG